jgi:tellurite resistance protein
MANGYWDVLGSIISKKRVTNEEIQTHFNSYMTNKMLMLHPRGVMMANVLNSCRGNKYIAKEKIAEYKALRKIVTLDRKLRLSMDKKDKHQEVIIELLQSHFKIGKTTAQEYFKILKGQRLIDIMELYARKNEKNLSKKEIEMVKDIRSALLAKKKELLK